MTPYAPTERARSPRAARLASIVVAAAAILGGLCRAGRRGDVLDHPRRPLGRRRGHLRGRQLARELQRQRRPARRGARHQHVDPGGHDPASGLVRHRPSQFGPEHGRRVARHGHAPGRRHLFDRRRRERDPHGLDDGHALRRAGRPDRRAHVGDSEDAPDDDPGSERLVHVQRHRRMEPQPEAQRGDADREPHRQEPRRDDADAGRRRGRQQVGRAARPDADRHLHDQGRPAVVRQGQPDGDRLDVPRRPDGEHPRRRLDAHVQPGDTRPERLALCVCFERRPPVVHVHRSQRRTRQDVDQEPRRYGARAHADALRERCHGRTGRGRPDRRLPRLPEPHDREHRVGHGARLHGAAGHGSRRGRRRHARRDGVHDPGPERQGSGSAGAPARRSASTLARPSQTPTTRS